MSLNSLRDASGHLWPSKYNCQPSGSRLRWRIAAVASVAAPRHSGRSIRCGICRVFSQKVSVKMCKVSGSWLFFKTWSSKLFFRTRWTKYKVRGLNVNFWRLTVAFPVKHKINCNKSGLESCNHEELLSQITQHCQRSDLLQVNCSPVSPATLSDFCRDKAVGTKQLDSFVVFYSWHFGQGTSFGTHVIQCYLTTDGTNSGCLGGERKPATI